MPPPHRSVADAHSSRESRSVAEWLEHVEEAERRGELLVAVDRAERGLAEHPSDPSLAHRAVLALARSGSTSEAARRFRDLGLEESDVEEIASLGARIEKDQALAASGAERRRRAAAAAAAYHSIYSRSRSYYPAINAATMNLVAGDRVAARAGAREVLELLERGRTGSYYALATAAEAELILGDEARAAEAIGLAGGAHGRDYAALTTTRRQLRLICEENGFDPEILSPLAGPTVAHYCGHRIAGDDEGGRRFPAAAEPAVADAIRAEVGRHEIGFAYGALASGADILWAEALLERGCELDVVLPFDRDEFIRHSVAPAGSGWVERFDRCLERAREVSYATTDAFLGDDVLYRYGSELAMGLALLHARYLDSEARQLALWDGAPATGAAGTAIDVAAWRRSGRPASIVDARTGIADPTTPTDAGRSSPAPPVSGRIVRAMLFSDVKGFSKLTDEEVPRFADHVLGAFAETLRRYRGAIGHRNTWGDALYVVLDDAEVAAECALDLQRAMREIDLAAHGLPSGLALRLGAHVGPVFPTYDPVLDKHGFMGSHVSRTARIEPVTPPGTVYVTEPFAAALSLAGRDDLSCDYVGHMPAAKGFGRLRMYRLERVATGRDAG